MGNPSSHEGSQPEVYIEFQVSFGRIVRFRLKKTSSKIKLNFTKYLACVRRKSSGQSLSQQGESGATVLGKDSVLAAQAQPLGSCWEVAWKDKIDKQETLSGNTGTRSSGLIRTPLALQIEVF